MFRFACRTRDPTKKHNKRHTMELCQGAVRIDESDETYRRILRRINVTVGRSARDPRFPAAVPISVSREMIMKARLVRNVVFPKTNGFHCILFCTRDPEPTSFMLSRSKVLWRVRVEGPGVLFDNTLLEGEVFTDPRVKRKRFAIFRCIRLYGNAMRDKTFTTRQRILQRLLEAYCPETHTSQGTTEFARCAERTHEETNRGATRYDSDMGDMGEDSDMSDDSDVSRYSVVHSRNTFRSGEPDLDFYAKKYYPLREMKRVFVESAKFGCDGIVIVPDVTHDKMLRLFPELKAKQTHTLDFTFCVRREKPNLKPSEFADEEGNKNGSSSHVYDVDVMYNSGGVPKNVFLHFIMDGHVAFNLRKHFKHPRTKNLIPTTQQPRKTTRGRRDVNR